MEKVKSYAYLIFSEEEYYSLQKTLIKQGYTWIHGGNEICTYTTLNGYLDFPIALNVDKQKTMMFFRLKKEHLKEARFKKQIRERKLKRILNDKR